MTSAKEAPIEYLRENPVLFDLGNPNEPRGYVGTNKVSITVAEVKKQVTFKWFGDHDWAFPDVAPGLEPFGSRVLVQIRTPRKKSKGGIILTDEGKETELWNTQIGLVRSVGPLSFRNRDNMKPWAEGPWCHVGSFIRCPKYGGDRWQVDLPDRSGDPALFVIFNDLDLIGGLTAGVDPLSIKAFV